MLQHLADLCSLYASASCPGARPGRFTQAGTLAGCLWRLAELAACQALLKYVSRSGVEQGSCFIAHANLTTEPNVFPGGPLCYQLDVGEPMVGETKRAWRQAKDGTSGQAQKQLIQQLLRLEGVWVCACVCK